MRVMRLKVAAVLSHLPCHLSASLGKNSIGCVVNCQVNPIDGRKNSTKTIKNFPSTFFVLSTPVIPNLHARCHELVPWVSLMNTIS